MIKQEVCDYDKEYKLCPSCLTLSQKNGKRSWGCPADDCDILDFVKGWAEWYHDAHFLSSVNWEEIL